MAPWQEARRRSGSGEHSIDSHQERSAVAQRGDRDICDHRGCRHALRAASYPPDTRPLLTQGGAEQAACVAETQQRPGSPMPTGHCSLTPHTSAPPQDEAGQREAASAADDQPHLSGVQPIRREVGGIREKVPRTQVPSVLSELHDVHAEHPAYRW